MKPRALADSSFSSLSALMRRHRRAPGHGAGPPPRMGRPLPRVVASCASARDRRPACRTKTKGRGTGLTSTGHSGIGSSWILRIEPPGDRPGMAHAMLGDKDHRGLTVGAVALRIPPGSTYGLQTLDLCRILFHIEYFLRRVIIHLTSQRIH